MGGQPSQAVAARAPRGGPSRVQWQVDGFYPKMPPKVEAMTMPRITQQMMIMIFFCKRQEGEGALLGRDQNEG